VLIWAYRLDTSIWDGGHSIWDDGLSVWDVGTTVQPPQPSGA
jgi:hypothetical protein